MTRAEIERLFVHALGALDLRVRVERALAAHPRHLPRIERDVRVIAIGKAAPAMAVGALAAWGPRIEQCLVVAPDGVDARMLAPAAKRAGLDAGVVLLRAAHPLPDLRSVRAGKACLDAVTTDMRRVVLVLVSGGASALVCAPAAGLRLSTKRAVTRVMLQSGASIQEVNTVRKHLSRLKGGGLARAARPNRVLTLVASDVVAGTAADVGSGPSVPDASGIREARRLLRRFAPSFADLRLVTTLSAASARREGVSIRPARIVASPEELARACAGLLRARGIRVHVLPASQSSAEELAVEYVKVAGRLVREASRHRSSRVRGVAVVRAAEPAIRVDDSRGSGGRACHTAALVARGLAGAGKGGRVVFAALASDGVDGTSGTSGAVIDDRFDRRVTARLGPGALEHAIARFDTGTLHRAMSTALVSNATGHNLADIHILVVECAR